MRFSITARDGRERGRDVDVLLDADPEDALIDVRAATYPITTSGAERWLYSVRP